MSTVTTITASSSETRVRFILLGHDSEPIGQYLDRDQAVIRLPLYSMILRDTLFSSTALETSPTSTDTLLLDMFFPGGSAKST